MKSALLHRLCKATTILSLGVIASLGLNGCGSGGNSDSQQGQIAPETLEGLSVTLFQSFTVTFFKLAGQPGNESGAGDFDGNAGSFNLGFTDNGNTIARPIEVPSIITNLSYTYTKTSADTGRIVFTWSGLREQSSAEAALESQSDYQGRQIFWENETMTMDVLFVDTNGVIRTTSSRVRGYEFRVVRYNRPENSPPILITNSSTTFEFDSPNAVFTVAGTLRPLPTNYQLDVSENTPSGIVWEDLRGRTIDFVGAGTPALRVSYQSAAGGLLEIPGVEGIDDSGTMLVDSLNQGVIGGPGDFGYRRTGGANAAFSIVYDLPAGGGPTDPVSTRIDYTLEFTTLDAGIWTDSNGNSGRFSEDLVTDNPQ